MAVRANVEYSFKEISLFPNTKEELRDVIGALEKKKDTIDLLATVLSRGTQKLIDADKEFRNTLSVSNVQEMVIRALLGAGCWIIDVFGDGNEISNAISEWEAIESILEKKYETLKLWEKETIKDIAKEVFGAGYDIYDIAECFEDGDYSEAIKKLGKKLTEKGIESVYAVLFADGDIAASLRVDYTLNLLELGAESVADIIENPSWKNVFNLFWSTTAAPFLQTAGDTAYDVLTLFPGLTDWYEEHGATDMGSVFNVVYEEVTRLAYGDKRANFVGDYYGDHGGIVDGLWEGFVDIVDFAKDYGIEELLKCTWHGLFG